MSIKATIQPKKRPQQGRGKSTTPKPKPKPPKAQPQKLVSKPMQCCPLQEQAVCDVDKLVLRVIIDDKEVPKMESTGGQRGTPVTDVKGKEVLQLLNAYDLVCDAVAQYPSPEEPNPEERVKSGATAYFHGRKCSKHEHGVFKLTPLTHMAELKGGPQIVRKQGASSIEFGTREYVANAALFDWGLRESGGIVALFDIIQGAWPLRDPKRLEYRAESCGIRAKNGEAVRRQLVALVRIYRKDTYSLGFKIPTLGKFSHSQEGQREFGSGKPYTKEASTSASVWGGPSYSSSSKTSGKGTLATYDYSRTTWSGGQGERHSSTREVQNGSVTTAYSHEHSDTKGVKYKNVDGTYSVEDIDKMLEKKGQDFELVLKRNDRDWKVPFNKDKLIKTVKTTWEQVQKVQEAIRKMPQLGWKFEFTISVFAGQFVIQFGPEVKNPRLLASGRYHPVDWLVTAKFKLTLVDIKLEVSLGIEWMAMGSGFRAKVAGEVGCNAALEGSVKVNLDNPNASLAPKMTSKLALKADAYAKLAGWSIVDASASVEFAIELKDGKLAISLDSGVKLTGSLVLKDTFLKAYIKKPWSSVAEPMDPYLVMKGRTLYTFG
jgi:hypothetical protein